MATVQCIEYRTPNGDTPTATATILKNLGISWKVRTLDGQEFPVPKKLVVRQWEEEESESEPEPAPASSLAGQLEAAAKPADPKPQPKDREGLVTLKELCFDLDIEPRVARRKLRKAQGKVGTGSRWEWTKDSAEYHAVCKVLAGTLPESDPEALSAADQEALDE